MADRSRLLAGLVAVSLAIAACGSAGDTTATTQSVAPTAVSSTTAAPARTSTASPSTTIAPTTTVTTTTTTTVPTSTAVDPPGWLGTQVLDTDDDGNVLPVATPSELVDRRFRTKDLLPPPSGGFVATVGAVPDDVLARSTWHDGCPVVPEDLRYVTVSFWGFDELPHTGELLVNARFADELVAVFGELYDTRFPIEEMRVVRAEELDAPPTGDGNNTTSFACRPTTGGTSWSQHAFGLAIDVNPFHNPYLRDGRVLPELATAYLNRDDVRPGMILDGDPVFEAFAAIGWGWGGDFRTLVDYMHFSANNH